MVVVTFFAIFHVIINLVSIITFGEIKLDGIELIGKVLSKAFQKLPNSCKFVKDQLSYDLSKMVVTMMVKS